MASNCYVQINAENSSASDTPEVYAQKIRTDEWQLIYNIGDTYVVVVLTNVEEFSDFVFSDYAPAYVEDTADDFECCVYCKTNEGIKTVAWDEFGETVFGDDSGVIVMSRDEYDASELEDNYPGATGLFM